MYNPDLQAMIKQKMTVKTIQKNLQQQKQMNIFLRIINVKYMSI